MVCYLLLAWRIHTYVLINIQKNIWSITDEHLCFTTWIFQWLLYTPFTFKSNFYNAVNKGKLQLTPSKKWLIGPSKFCFKQTFKTSLVVLLSFYFSP